MGKSLKKKRGSGGTAVESKENQREPKSAGTESTGDNSSFLQPNLRIAAVLLIGLLFFSNIYGSLILPFFLKFL